MLLKICIHSNEGYGADQVRGRITVGELRNMLEGYDDNDEIVTFDLNNRRGASYGTIDVDEWIEEVDEDEEDEDEEDEDE